MTSGVRALASDVLALVGSWYANYSCYIDIVSKGEQTVHKVVD